jgi:enoyl-CoA hydratase/carnithine racemase
MIHDRIELSVENHVAHVQLARADKMNALDNKMFEAITMVGEQILADSSIRVVVLSGQGGNFCAGLDKSNFESIVAKQGLALDPDQPPVGLSARTKGIANDPQHIVWMWRELPMPVIAAVEGVALGGGFHIALGADMRYAKAQSKFSILELKWGLVPDMSSTQIMRHLAPDDVIRELTYTARIFSAQEAKQWGFITDIVDDPVAHALSLANDIACKNPHAIRGAKKIIDSANYQTAAEGLLMESQVQDGIIGTPNQIEAIMAAMQKRQPKFED